MKELWHIAHRPAHAQAGRYVCECVGKNPGECMCKSTARDRRARMRAEAYRSMAYAHGQLWHVSAALWQVYVAEQSHIREGKIPIGMVSYSRSAPEAHGP